MTMKDAMTLHLFNARLINPDAGTDAPGSLTVHNGVIAALNAAAPKCATQWSAA